jgi:hypothetical protein
MNRLLSGAVIAWRTKDVRKMKRAEAWCADYGLKPIHKALHAGLLYKNERQTLDRKFKSLLNGKNDKYCILTLCASCLKDFDSTHVFLEKTATYEIV